MPDADNNKNEHAALDDFSRAVPSPMSLSSQPPVVILGVNEMALAAARSLHGRHGIRVVALHHGDRSSAPAGYSRHVELRCVPRRVALLDALLALADELGARPVLLPARDSAVLFLHRHRRQLETRFRFYVWSSDVLVELGSKRTLAAVAARYSLPVPKTFVPRTRAELESAVGKLRFPSIVKPEFTAQWWSESAVALGLNHKAIAVRDARELLELYDRSTRLGAQVVVQSIVDGRDSDHFCYAAFVAPDGTIPAELVVRKLRIHPPRFGIGSYVVSVRDSEVLEVGREILRRLGFRGFASVQLKRDGANGRPHLLEIGLRLPTWAELASAAGTDFSLCYYRTCTGEALAHAVPRIGCAWMSLGRDWRSMRFYARSGEWTWWQWVRQCLGGPVHALFRWDDPVPWLVAAVRSLSSIVARHVRTGRACEPRVRPAQRSADRVSRLG